MTISLNAQTLDSFQWKNRLVVLVGDISKQNLEAFKSYEVLPKEITERKLVFLHIQPNSIAEILPNTQKPIENLQLYQSFKDSYPRQSIFLIGLDGGVKRSTNTLFNPKELFRIIDSMPMRASEIRRKNE